MSNQAHDIATAVRWVEVAHGYRVSELGDVIGPKGPIALRVDANGWPVFSAGNREQRLHRVVYQAFHDVKLRRNQSVIPVDGNRLNCALSNLRLMGRTDLEPVESLPGEVWRHYHDDPNKDPQMVSNMGRARGKRGLLAIRLSSKCNRWVFSSPNSEKGLFSATYQAFVGPVPPGHGVVLVGVDYKPGVVFRPEDLRMV